MGLCKRQIYKSRGSWGNVSFCEALPPKKKKKKRVFSFLAGSFWGMSSERGRYVLKNSAAVSPWLRWLWSPPSVSAPSLWALPPSSSRHLTKHKFYQYFQVKMDKSCSFCVCCLISFSSHSWGIESCKCSPFQTALPSWEPNQSLLPLGARTHISLVPRKTG